MTAPRTVLDALRTLGPSTFERLQDHTGLAEKALGYALISLAFAGLVACPDPKRQRLYELTEGTNGTDDTA